MSKSVWAEARGLAFRETLELARLNDPFRIAITLGVPLATLLGVWFISHQLAQAAAVGLLALCSLAAATFVVKVFTNVGRLAEDARAKARERMDDDDRAERDRRKNKIEKLVQLYRLERDDEVSAAIKAGLALPPEDWLNEHLAEDGEEWQIFDIRGTQYSTFQIVAGEWRYRGKRLGSGAAIRWAAFFDALRIDWKPGNEDWDPESGRPPDFSLPQMNAYFAVEYVPSDAKDVGHREMARKTGRRVIVASGEPAWAKENLRLFDEDDWDKIGRLAWAEDRRDEGVYWLTKVDGGASVCLGGPGKQTDHARGPLITEKLQRAFDAARQQQVEFKPQR